MKALFFIAVFAAISIGFWQLAKIFGATKEEQTATKKENNINGWMMLFMLAFIHGLLIFCMVAYGDVLLPELSASSEGEHIDILFKITFGLILFVQFFTQILIFFFAFKYRGNIDRKATFYADSHKLEVIWTSVPAIVLTILVLYGIYTWNKVMDVSNQNDPLYIELYAKQFQWEARYAGADKTLGDANVRNIKGINTMGVNMDDKNSADDITVLHEFHIPKGRKVVFQFRSQDVLHSAYMPHFRAQMNCVPGMNTYFGFTPSVTTVEMRKNQDVINKVEGINKIRKEKSIVLEANGEDVLEPYVFDYLLLCNKICGASHYNMQMKIIVDEVEDYNAWISKQKTLASKIN